MPANAHANAENIIMENSNAKKKPLIIIPAYNPNQPLLDLVNGLSAMGFEHILIIDDGTEQKNQWVFDRLLTLPFCTVIRHDKNRGKGAALKTGLKSFINDFTNYNTAITADADGQHSLEAIRAVSNAVQDKNSCLVLGTRDFSKMNLPFRNKLGKMLTQKILSFFLSQDIVDIQTGLRGIPKGLAAAFLSLSGDSHDYESNVILQCQRESIPIFQVPIKTSFIKKNHGDNYHPVLEALKIYWQFIKFIMVSLITTAIDTVTFMLFVFLFINASPNNYILYATVVSRIISLLINYILNHKTVFHSYAGKRKTLWKYGLLCAINILMSAYLVKSIYLLTVMAVNLAVIKLLVSFILFFFNYYLQKKWVFRTKTI
ncbi:MAG: glycosyltransferase [Bacillota bacterium]|jgi:putative flippase GtrA